MTKEVKLKADFIEWRRDTSLIDLFNESKQKVLRGETHKVVIQAYLYIPEKGEHDIVTGGADISLKILADLTMTQQLNSVTLPLVKILNSTNPDIKVNSVYSVKDSLAMIQPNAAYTDWYSRRAMQPSLEGKEAKPPMFFMGWDAWVNWKYRINKFNLQITNPHEEMTFLVPENVLITECEYGLDLI